MPTVPYREPPRARQRFFISSDGTTFIDLDIVAIAYFYPALPNGTGEDEFDRVEFWRHQDASDDETDGWKLHGLDAREFMVELAAYRRGDL